MNRVAIVTWLVIGGVVWGGLLWILATAVWKERRKVSDPRMGPGGGEAGGEGRG